MKRLIFTLIILGGIVFASNALAVEFELKYTPPCLLETQFGPCPVTATSVAAYIKRIYQFGLGIAGVLAVGMIVVGGIYFSISAGNPSRQSEGKSYITSAIWGLILLFGSYVILRTVNPQLVNLREPNLPSAPISTFEGQAIPPEGDIPEPSTDPAKWQQCFLLTGGNNEGQNNCLRGICVDHLTYPPFEAGCQTMVQMDPNDIPIKSGQCHWGREPSNCFINPQLYSILLALQERLRSLGLDNAFQVTEAYPPTVKHSKYGGHYTGCAVDLTATVPPDGDICGRAIQIRDAARAVWGSATVLNEYSGCAGATPSGDWTGGHIHIALPLSECP